MFIDPRRHVRAPSQQNEHDMTEAILGAGDISPRPLSPSTPSVDDIQTAPASDAFAQLGLAPELLRAVADLGFTEPTEVQRQAIAFALPSEVGTDEASGATASDDADAISDLMVSSRTGSGKTAAFLLPLLQRLLAQQQCAEALARAAAEQAAADAAQRGEAAPKKPRRRNPTDPRNFRPAEPGALVLCPTRELAQQVAHDAIALVRHCRGLRVAAVIGGMPYPVQIARLQNASIVVATPGRLLDLQRSGQIRLEQVQFLVVDEADRMLDLGFADDLAEINRLTQGRRQTMMFSATFAPRIEQLARRVMRGGVRRLEVGAPRQPHANIRQVLHWADDAGHKRRLLDHWLRDAAIEQAIVFASTQVECDALAGALQDDGFSAVALHGALSQGLRNRRLGLLRNQQVQILVATDVAARGIDLPGVSHVFNFGLPMKPEDYTHRIGRTGRAGRDGIAVTLAEPRDRRRIGDIESWCRQRFDAEVIPGLEPRRTMQPARPVPAANRRGRAAPARAPARAPERRAGHGFSKESAASQRGSFAGSYRNGSKRDAAPRRGGARPR